MSQTVDLNEEILPIYQPAFYDESRFLVLKGGAGSGKSVFAAQKIITRCMTEPNHRFLVLRKVDRTIRDSCFQLCKDILDWWGLTEQAQVHKSEMRITIPSVGGGESEILFKGLDDREKIKSIQGVSGIWFEEATEFDLDDLTQLNLRLRGETTGYKQIILTFNPISEKHWLKKRFYDAKEDNISLFHSTYLDNSHLDKEYTEELLQLGELDPDYYRVYCLGEWGIIKTGSEFFYTFNRQKHVGKFGYNPNKWLVVTRDFNNLPYMTSLLCQVDGRTITVFDEVCLPPPANSIEDTVARIIDKVPDISSVIECGDPSGKAKVARKTRAEAKNYYVQVRDTWREYRVNMVDKVPRSAPPLSSRQMAYTKLLGGWQGFSLQVDESCTNLIYDLESLQLDTTGGWVKKKVTDKKTGASYEEGGHCADALTYLLYSQYPFLFSRKKSSGLLV